MVGSYSYWLVLLSIVVAIFASYTALDLSTRITASKGRSAQLWLIGGAFSMGVGIWSMHFIGMLAFSLPIPMGYDVPITLLSMLIAVVVSYFALFTVTRRTVSSRNLAVGGTLMGLGICAMHYTGMAAMDMSPPIRYDPWLFAASIAVAIVAALAALWMAFHLRANENWMIYAKLGSAVIMGFAITGMHYTGMAAARFDHDTVCLKGASVDNSWMAGTIAAFTFIILCVTLMLSLYDARVASRTARMAASLQEANEELQRMALQDGLTRLPNRLLLEDRLGQAIAHAQRSRVVCAVLFVDLDRFKTVNDTLGHFVGDELLKAVAARLLSAVRSADTVSRMGGDEFVVLLGEIAQADDAEKAAGKVLAALREPFQVLGHELVITSSIGISLFPFHGRDARALITNADAAMYGVKKSGRNSFQFFSEENTTFFPERLKTEHELRQAVARRQFELHYQPRVDVATGVTLGMEALLRWRHPEKGLVMPDDFIPLAEETGLILPIGDWVMQEACRQNKAWQNKGLRPLRVSVNISALQFQQKSLLDGIADALRKSGLDPAYLEVEITESVVMQKASEAIGTLQELARMGVHISIDDFGTGYSSLSYLKRFPLHTLKIDRSFIRDLSTNQDDATIVVAIVAMAHNLRLKVVAEGVETSDQLRLLHALGTDEYQGYHHSRPVAAAEFEIILAQLRGAGTFEGPGGGKPKDA
jgi:diguanylate cyclase (GGDEF)-like protein